MNATKFVETRSPAWKRLEVLAAQLERRSTERKLDAAARVEFASLYREACADLALADGYQLPAGTVRYLHQLVGRAHNQLYRAHQVNVRDWRKTLVEDIPRTLLHDWSVRLAAVLFWLPFLAAMFLSSRYTPIPEFAETVMTREAMMMMEQMHSQPLSGPNAKPRDGFGLGGTGFYLFHNASIGMRCFVWGLGMGVLGMFATVFNGMYLGAAFGYMSTTPNSPYFYEFVTAHGPFELTAIVFAAGAGMKIGFALIFTRGLRRVDSFHHAAREAMPVMFTAIFLFLAAGAIEAIISPSRAPYEIKALVAMLSTLAILGYVVLLGYKAPMEGLSATEMPAKPASPFDEPV